MNEKHRFFCVKKRAFLSFNKLYAAFKRLIVDIFVISQIKRGLPL